MARRRGKVWVNNTLFSFFREFATFVPPCALHSQPKDKISSSCYCWLSMGMTVRMSQWSSFFQPNVTWICKMVHTVQLLMLCTHHHKGVILSVPCCAGYYLGFTTHAFQSAYARPNSSYNSNGSTSCYYWHTNEVSKHERKEWEMKLLARGTELRGWT